MPRIEPYLPEEEQIRAQRQGIYESEVRRALGAKTFRDRQGLRIDRSLRPEVVRSFAQKMFSIGTGVPQAHGRLQKGSQNVTQKTKEESRRRYQDADHLLRNRQDYEETLALARKGPFFRVTEEPTPSGKAYFVWPLFVGVEYPVGFATQREAEEAANQINSVFGRPDGRGDWPGWWIPPARRYNKKELAYWLPPDSYWGGRRNPDTVGSSSDERKTIARMREILPYRSDDSVRGLGAVEYFIIRTKPDFDLLSVYATGHNPSRSMVAYWEKQLAAEVLKRGGVKYAKNFLPARWLDHAEAAAKSQNWDQVEALLQLVPSLSHGALSPIEGAWLLMFSIPWADRPTLFPAVSLFEDSVESIQRHTPGRYSHMLFNDPDYRVSPTIDRAGAAWYLWATEEVPSLAAGVDAVKRNYPAKPKAYTNPRKARANSKKGASSSVTQAIVHGAQPEKAFFAKKGFTPDPVERDFSSLTRKTDTSAYRRVTDEERWMLLHEPEVHGSGSRGGYTAQERDRIPSSHFLVPETRSWPVSDEIHANIALRYMMRGFGKTADYPHLLRRLAALWPPQAYPELWSHYTNNIATIQRHTRAKLPKMGELRAIGRETDEQIRRRR